MADSDDRYDNEGSSGSGSFMLGLLTGTVLGAGLGILLAPKAGSELRGALGEQARQFGSKASEQYRRASGSTAQWAEKSREFVDRARDTVTRGVEDAREYVDTTVSSVKGKANAKPGAHPFGDGSGTGGSVASS
jgi:gas vesicle protein